MVVFKTLVNDNYLSLVIFWFLYSSATDAMATNTGCFNQRLEQVFYILKLFDII